MKFITGTLGKINFDELISSTAKTKSLKRRCFTCKRSSAEVVLHHTQLNNGKLNQKKHYYCQQCIDSLTGFNARTQILRSIMRPTN